MCTVDFKRWDDGFRKRLHEELFDARKADKNDQFRFRRLDQMDEDVCSKKRLPEYQRSNKITLDKWDRQRTRKSTLFSKVFEQLAEDTTGKDLTWKGEHCRVPLTHTTDHITPHVCKHTKQALKHQNTQALTTNRTKQHTHLAATEKRRNTQTQFTSKSDLISCCCCVCVCVCVCFFFVLIFCFVKCFLLSSKQRDHKDVLRSHRQIVLIHIGQTSRTGKPVASRAKLQDWMSGVNAPVPSPRSCCCVERPSKTLNCGHFFGKRYL